MRLLVIAVMVLTVLAQGASPWGASLNGPLT